MLNGLGFGESTLLWCLGFNSKRVVNVLTWNDPFNKQIKWVVLGYPKTGRVRVELA